MNDDADIIISGETAKWSYTQIQDWIMLLDLNPNAFRLYCTMRSLLLDGKRKTVTTHRLSQAELCCLVSVNPNRPVTDRAVRNWLKELADAGLIVAIGAVITSSGRGGIGSQARSYRILDSPPKGYQGWRNAWDKLDACRNGSEPGRPDVSAGRIDRNGGSARKDVSAGRIDRNDGSGSKEVGTTVPGVGTSVPSNVPPTCENEPLIRPTKEDSLSGTDLILSSAGLDAQARESFKGWADASLPGGPKGPGWFVVAQRDNHLAGHVAAFQKTQQQRNSSREPCPKHPGNLKRSCIDCQIGL